MSKVSVTDFARAIAALAEAEARFVVIGGVALVLHGGQHITEDIDFAYERTRENARRIAEALRSYDPRPRGYPEDVPFVWDDQTLYATTVLTLETGIGPVDLLGAPDGAPPFRELFERATPLEIGGREVRVCALEDLLAMKRAANRDKDQRHILEIQGLMERDRSESEE